MPRTINVSYTHLIIRRIAFLSVVLICALLLIGISIKSVSNSSDTTSGIGEKFYTSIEVSKGDTLWSIADDYAVRGYADKRAYVDEISKLNHLKSETIHAGEHLVIPYYDVRVKRNFDPDYDAQHAR